MAIANSIKSKNKIYQKFSKGKKHTQKRKFMKSCLKLIGTILLRITKDEYYKNHFKENKKQIQNCKKNY